VALRWKKNRTVWLWLAVDRDSRNISGFRIGSRSRKALKKMMFYSSLKAERYATDDYRAYRLLPKEKRLVGKAHTFTIESKNSQVRHYLARFHRRTKCYSKSVHSIYDALTLLIHKINTCILC
jgi:insertion element IS1 protein InsB